MNNFLSPISEIIEDARNGKMFILVDGPERENEGDLIVSAQHVTNAQMTQMINYGSGIVCLVINEERRRMLNLELQPRRGDRVDEFYTAFLTSIEAKEGISTGVSSEDRVTTIKTAISNDNPEQQIITPGHIFPLLVNKGGLKARCGHTEASATIMKLAGLEESAVLCELMNKDGKMSRMSDLVNLANELGLKISSIELLLEHIEKIELREQLACIQQNQSTILQENA